MRKRKLPVIMALALMCCLVMLTGKSVEASEGEKIDGSYLTEGDSSAGKAVLKMRGVYLMEGDCSISKAGRGRAYVYASTTANMTVDYVGVIVRVEQYDEANESWVQVDAWTADEANTYYVSTSKTVTVERGYYYRVHAEHIAGPVDGEKDTGDSITDGIKIN